MTEVFHPQRFAMFERLGCTDGMQAAKQLSETIQLVVVARLRRTAGAASVAGALAPLAAIAMHADIGVRGGGVDVFNPLEQVAGDGLVGREQAARYEEIGRAHV